MNKPDITSLCLYSTLQFSSQFQHVSYKSARGIVANNQNVCSSCDSRIGFGTGGHFDDYNTCGNQATHGGGNGDQHIKAMGYILVQ